MHSCLQQRAEPKNAFIFVTQRFERGHKSVLAGVHGARIPSKRRAGAGIRFTVGEFDHCRPDIDCRMDTSLPFLYSGNHLP
jgi:hypothetical protein